jgi:hypothetical protein
MGEMEPIDYEPAGARRRPISGEAVTALVAGSLSGPASWLVLMFVVRSVNGIEYELVAGVLAIAGWLSCPFLAFVYSAVVYDELGKDYSPRGRGLALAGLLAATAWEILLWACAWRALSFL